MKSWFVSPVSKANSSLTAKDRGCSLKDYSTFNDNIDHIYTRLKQILEYWDTAMGLGFGGRATTGSR
jgi:hypothetical protein